MLGTDPTRQDSVPNKIVKTAIFISTPSLCGRPHCDLRLFHPSYFFEEHSDRHLILRISLLSPEIHFFTLDLIIGQDTSMMNLHSVGSLEPCDCNNETGAIRQGLQRVDQTLAKRPRPDKCGL